MRVVLVVNATAAAMSHRSRELVEATLGRNHDVTVEETTAPQHACQLARSAASAGADVVVALGGDGTVNEVANGLVGTSTALGVLPGGSTNVFARTIGLPNRAVPAARRLTSALDAGSIRRVGMGVAGERYFLFHLGVGFDAAVVDQVEHRAALKRRLGHGLFAYSALTTWLTHYDRSRPRFTLELPDGETIDHGYFAICQKTDPYTFLGPRPFHLVRGTGFDTGLSLVVLRDLSASTVLSAAAAALVGGQRLAGLGCVEVRSDLESVKVIGHGLFPHQVDGDYLGEVESLDVSHRADCLDLVVPLPA